MPPSHLFSSLVEVAMQSQYAFDSRLSLRINFWEGAFDLMHFTLHRVCQRDASKIWSNIRRIDQKDILEIYFDIQTLLACWQVLKLPIMAFFSAPFVLASFW